MSKALIDSACAFIDAHQTVFRCFLYLAQKTESESGQDAFSGHAQHLQTIANWVRRLTKLNSDEEFAECAQAELALDKWKEEICAMRAAHNIKRRKKGGANLPLFQLPESTADIKAAQALLANTTAKNKPVNKAIQSHLIALPIPDNDADFQILLKQAANETDNALLRQMLPLAGDLLFSAPETWMEQDPNRADRYRERAAMMKDAWGLWVEQDGVKY